MATVYDGSLPPWVARARALRPGPLGGFLGSLGKFIQSPGGASAVGVASSVLQNVWSARRADTAHQREVRDLQAAGLNPSLSARGGGLEVGPMVAPMEGVNSALAVQRQRAEIEVLRSQARNLNTQSNVASSMMPVQAAEAQARTALANQNVSQLQAVLPTLRDKALAEIQQLKHSALRTEAERFLLSADLARAKNIEAFEKSLGSASPTLKLFLEVLRTLSQARR